MSRGGPAEAGRLPRGTVLRKWLDRNKPRLGQRGQLFVAQMMWGLVGTSLLTVGLVWVLGHWGGAGVTYALLFVCLGLVKGFFVLDRAALRSIERIAARGRNACAGGFFSKWSWFLVLGMMLFGQLARHSPIPRADIGLLYVAVGTALLFSSRRFWRRWWALRFAAKGGLEA